MKHRNLRCILVWVGTGCIGTGSRYPTLPITHHHYTPTSHQHTNIKPITHQRHTDYTPTSHRLHTTITHQHHTNTHQRHTQTLAPTQMHPLSVTPDPTSC